MAAPQFRPDGFLPEGLHSLTPTEFLEAFCKEGSRAHFNLPMRDVFGFATGRGARALIVGGSFVSSKADPADLDCAIVFAEESQIPDRTERVELSGVRLDVIFCAADQKGMMGSLISMFAKTRNQMPVGVVVIPLQSETGHDLWNSWDLEDTTGIEIIKRAYMFRHFVDRNPNGKALVTVHGIRSHAEWNAEITHIASSNGWIVAPFTYGYVEATIFQNKSRRTEIIDRFRDHLDDIASRYSCDVSIIAHSFGTFIAASYLSGFDIAPVPIDTLILTGSVLDPDLDFERFEGSVYRVVHERAPNDKVVQYALPASLWRLKLLGRSGEVGFKNISDMIEERTCDIFNHTNVIRRDVVARRWMPRLEMNVGKARIAASQRMIASFRKARDREKPKPKHD